MQEVDVVVVQVSCSNNVGSVGEGNDTLVFST